MAGHGKAATFVLVPALVGRPGTGIESPRRCRSAATLPSPSPRPALRGGEATGQYRQQAACQGRTVAAEPDVLEDFFHDVPEDVTSEALRQPETSRRATHHGSSPPMSTLVALSPSAAATPRLAGTVRRA